MPEIDCLEDFYYVENYVLHTACVDHKLDRKDMHETASLLFFSLLLRKRFNLDICFATTAVLNSLRSNPLIGETLEKEAVIKESIEEDDFIIKNGSGTTYVRPVTAVISPELNSTLVSATVKAGECAGKVKVVVHETLVDMVNSVIEQSELPLLAISANQAMQELKAIHEHHMSGSAKPSVSTHPKGL